LNGGDVIVAGGSGELRALPDAIAAAAELGLKAISPLRRPATAVMRRNAARIVRATRKIIPAPSAQALAVDRACETASDFLYRLHQAQAGSHPVSTGRCSGSLRAARQNVQT